LYICGEGPLAGEVTLRAAANPKVHYMGPVGGDAKRQLIRKCRAMIAPSLWWEPLGLVTYEAYEFCKPMLAAASGGLSETVFQGETGFLHAPGCHNDLTDQILELEANPDKAAQMGLAGRKWLESSTSREQWLDSFNAVLDRLS
jgi:glycosyltransferase involved in cell wall biosynthesis